MTNSHKKDKSLRYIAYVRRSEERDERQELSIPAQIDEIEKRFPGLNIIDLVEEKQSAFLPGRPIFNRVMDRIENGEAEGIVGYHPNRLCRNEIDSGRVCFALRSPLKDLKFCTYNFDNSPEGIWMLQNVMNQGQYESSKQSREVKRGMAKKASNGERPGQVALGYMKVAVLDENGNPVIRPKENKLLTITGKDPDRYDLVKKMWRLFLTGTYTVPQIAKQINNDGFTTRTVYRKDKKTGKRIRVEGGPITKTGVYRIFTNPFYAGYLYHKGELHEGNHLKIKMISLADFDYAQTLLGKKGKPRLGVNEYAYTSLIRCGECNCSIAGKIVWKWIKSDKRMKAFVYYYCIRSSSKRPCTQSKYTTLEQLEKDIDLELAKYTILPEFRDLALEILQRTHKVEVKERNQIFESQEKKRKLLQAEIDELVRMRTRQILDDDEYIEQRNRLKYEMVQISDGLKNTQIRADNWLELTEKAFEFATYARVRFQTTKDLKIKRDILLTLGQNLLLKDQKLSLERSEWLVPIAEQYPKIEAEYLRSIGTANIVSHKEKIAALEPIIESWRAHRDSNPGHEA